MRRSGWRVISAMAVLIAVSAACGSEDGIVGDHGRLGGHVVVSGPLRNAAVSIDQLDYFSTKRAVVRAHVADTTTDDKGWFAPVDVGVYNGVLVITAKGGSFTDPISGAIIELDPDDGIDTMIHFQIVDDVEDALVSPVGAMIAARMRWEMTDHGPDIITAEEHAEAVLDKHFGDVPWTRLSLASLDAPATSPTESVRGALVQTAFTYLASDIRQAAGASPQDVNVLRLTQQLAADLEADGNFNGNDDNNAAPNSGLQLGVCAQITPCSGVNSTDVCAREACRTQCDLYAGTPRAMLAGQLTKLISNPTLNKTGLVTGDVLGVARAIANSTEPSLFASNLCPQQLDRVPPTVMFSTSPADGDFVHGTVTLMATAIDDVDLPPAPAVEIVGVADADGDLRNNIATVAVNTFSATAGLDGMLGLTARATDSAGNTATATRVLQVDNTVPVVVPGEANFVVDGATWWTANVRPTLTGTFTEAHPLGVEAVIGAARIPGSLRDGSWSVDLSGVAEGAVFAGVDPAGTDVSIEITDLAGNRGAAVRRLRFDATPPVVAPLVSQVHTEATEAPTFDDDGGPTHDHSGALVDIAQPNGCAPITKYSYLLGPSSPPFVTERVRNPLLYQIRVSDDGVGVQADAAQYRVARGDPSNPQWVTGMLSMGPATPVDGAPGTATYQVALTSDVVPGLDTTEGNYTVEFQATDKFGRRSTEQRCFSLKLRAPPLLMGTMTIALPGGSPRVYLAGTAENHPFAFHSLSLSPGAPFDRLSDRLLNVGAAASLADMPVTNGTASTVYLSVSLERAPNLNVTTTKTFAWGGFVQGTSTVEINCDQHPLDCDNMAPVTYNSPTLTSTAVGVSAFVRVYQLDVQGMPATQIPCTNGCVDASASFQFALPGRTDSGPPPRYLVMTMVGQLMSLWPKDDLDHPGAPPFRDFSVGGVSLTGLQLSSVTGCSSIVFIAGVEHCKQQTTYIPYRALTFASFNLPSGFFRTSYANSATSSLTPDPAAPPLQTVSLWSWSATEGTLPH